MVTLSLDKQNPGRILCLEEDEMCGLPSPIRVCLKLQQTTKKKFSITAPSLQNIRDTFSQMLITNKTACNSTQGDKSHAYKCINGDFWIQAAG